jgi:hypothetical protein
MLDDYARAHSMLPKTPFINASMHTMPDKKHKKQESRGVSFNRRYIPFGAAQ